MEPLWVGVVILSELLAVLAVLLYLTGRRLVRLEREHERLLAIVTAHLTQQHLADLLDAYDRSSTPETLDEVTARKSKAEL